MCYISVLVMALLIQVGCSAFHGCEESMAIEAKSPNGQAMARHFLRNCGATTDYSSIVRVTAPTELGREGDEVFVASGDHNIRLYWKDDATLRIICDDCSDDHVFKRLSMTHGVKVVYK